MIDAPPVPVPHGPQTGRPREGEHRPWARWYDRRVSTTGDDARRAEILGIESRREPGAAVIRLRGELDLAGAPRLAEAVREQARDGEPVVLDMSEVTFIDSTGVRTLLDAARAVDVPLALLAPSHRVVRVLELTRLRDRLPELPDLSPSSLASLNRADPRV